IIFINFFFSSRRRHTRFSRDWSSDVCSSDLGMRVRDLELPRNRCIFNLRSALWAAENYKETPKFATKFVPRGPFSKKSRSKRIRSEERRVGKEGRSRCSPER